MDMLGIVHGGKKEKDMKFRRAKEYGKAEQAKAMAGDRMARANAEMDRAQSIPRHDDPKIVSNPYISVTTAQAEEMKNFRKMVEEEEKEISENSSSPVEEAFDKIDHSLTLLSDELNILGKRLSFFLSDAKEHIPDVYRGESKPVEENRPQPKQSDAVCKLMGVKKRVESERQKVQELLEGLDI
jgi:hypothetical protein